MHFHIISYDTVIPGVESVSTIFEMFFYRTNPLLSKPHGLRLSFRAYPTP